MKVIHRALVLTAAGLAAAGCTRRVVVVETPPSTAARGPNTAVTLGVPPGHLPPPGMCRVWIPGRPPGRQARARSCDGIVAVAPAGGWILYRPDADRRVVQVRYLDQRRVGIVIRVRVFDAESGVFIRDERQ
ncbi:MAG: hypothetical protein HYW06_02675 [Gemmatimonadetes bacterium]|nr:hypothetical protein [Gemmatimonadota bacterium]MBI2535878.1 hypothetical protein [Gemmatimonadota bacterium]